MRVLKDMCCMDTTLFDTAARALWCAKSCTRGLCCMLYVLIVKVHKCCPGGCLQHAYMLQQPLDLAAERLCLLLALLLSKL